MFRLGREWPRPKIITRSISRLCGKNNYSYNKTSNRQLQSSHTFKQLNTWIHRMMDLGMYRVPTTPKFSRCYFSKKNRVWRKIRTWIINLLLFPMQTKTKPQKPQNLPGRQPLSKLSPPKQPLTSPVPPNSRPPWKLRWWMSHIFSINLTMIWSGETS